MVEVAESKIYAPHAELKEDKMRGSTLWLATGVLLFLAWAISYFVFHVAGVLINLLLILALISFIIYVFTGKRGVE
jgi:hypothetical protein